MKMNKRITIILTAVLLVAVMIPLLCIMAKEEKPYQVYFFDSFEDLTVGDASYTAGKGGECVIGKAEDRNHFVSIISKTGAVRTEFPMDTTLRGVIGISIRVLENDLKANVRLYAQTFQQKKFELAMLNADGTLTLTESNTTVTLPNAGGPYELRFLIDTDKKVVSVYQNGTVLTEGQTFTNLGLRKLVAESTRLDGQEAAEVKLDNVIIYSGNAITGQEDVAQIIREQSTGTRSAMREAVVMYLNKSTILLHGDPEHISDNREIVPFEKDNFVYLPAAFFAESIGGTCSAADGKATITVGEKTATVDVIQGPGEASYAEMQALCTPFDLYLHYETNGLILYCHYNLDHLWNWSNNLEFVRDVVMSFIIDDINGSDFTSLVKQNYPNQGHPRLIMTPDKIATLQAAINDPNGDEVYKKTFESLQIYAGSYLRTKPSAYEIRDGIRLLYVCQENENRILVTAMMYLLTGEEKYAECAYETMRVCAEFKDWNPYHFLDVGTLAGALGIGYDWLYNWMDDSQRDLIRTALIEKAFAPYMEDLDDLPRKRSWNWRGELFDNWCMIISGECVAGLAICDELDGYDLECAERAMKYSYIDLAKALLLFSPYGAYDEGPGYWSYGMNYAIQTWQSVITATGTDFGFIDSPGVSMTNQYLMAINGSVAQFSYHDMGRAGINYPPQVMFLADYFGNYAEGNLRADMIRNSAAHSFSALYTVADMYLYNPKFATEPLDRSQMNTYLPISEIAVFRTGFDREDTYVGLHCDDPIGGDSHDHMDVGTFTLHSQGQDFFIDLGSDNYNISNYHGSYRVRAEGHNTVVFNPSKDWDQKYGGTASIVEFFSDGHGGYAIGDLSNAYEKSTGVTSFRRGIRLDADQDVVILQDEIRASSSTDMWWFAHTEAMITLNEDKTRAVLNLKGKKLVVEIQKGEGATFEVMAAEPLPTSPVVPDQAVNTGVCKLAIHIPKCNDLDLVVTFAAESVDEAGFDYKFVPLDYWDGSEPPPSVTDTDTNTDSTVTTDPAGTDGTETTPSSADSSMSTGIVVGIVAGVVVVVGVVVAIILIKKRK